METQPLDLSSLFPNIAVQLRSALNTLHLAAVQLVPAAERERDPELDSRAALLDQSYYRLLRTVNNLTAAGYLGILSAEQLMESIRNVFAPKGDGIVDMNLKAFGKGQEYGRRQ